VKTTIPAAAQGKLFPGACKQFVLILLQAAHCMLECECAGRARFIIYYGNDRRWPEVNGKYNESSDARGRKGAVCRERRAPHLQ